MGGIMCDGRQKGGAMREHAMSDPHCPIDMAKPMAGPGTRLQKNIGGGGGAKPTLSVPAAAPFNTLRCRNPASTLHTVRPW